jgi:uncharacterized protein with PIN domain
LSVQQRETVLYVIVSRLDTAASIARHEGDPIWKLLQKLSSELDANQIQIASDFSDTATAVIRSAISLLARFELGESAGMLH